MRFTFTRTGVKKPLRMTALLFVACAVLFSGLSGPAEAAKKKVRKAHPAKSAKYRKKANAVDRYASIVIDAATGDVLIQKDPDRKLYPASLTKMMTLYLAFEAIENGTLRKNERLPVSRHAAVQEPSVLGLKPGATIRVEDAILALVTKSANDVAVVLAEGLGGSESKFANLMTARARALGMNNTRFVNASGLFDPAQVSTARDMATLSLALLRDYPQHYHYFSRRNFTFAGRTHGNHNKLMQTYEGMDGIKTGYVHQSGFNLAASAVRDGRRLIGVVFGGRTTATRNAKMASLLNQGFARPASLRLAAAARPERRPQFDAMGLVMKDERAAPGNPAGGIEEGDAADDPRFSEQFRPKPISTRTLGAWRNRDEPEPRLIAAAAAPRGGAYVVQIGAFGSKVSGMQALRKAQARIPAAVARGTKPIVVPLVTNRGTIYRARLTGLGRAEAENACRVLRGNCLILAAQ